MNFKIQIIIIGLLGFSKVYAQQPIPAKPQAKDILVTGAEIHIGNGKVITKGDVYIKNGKLEYVGPHYTGATTGVKMVKADGKKVYPGFIAMNSILGLTEVEAIRATRDANEVGDNNANARSIIAYNTDSRVTPTVRSNGVLLAQIVPQGGIIQGSSSVVNLDAWNWEDAAYSLDEGLHLSWPSMTFYRAWWAPPIEKQKEELANNLESIEKEFAFSKTYAESANPEYNLRMEAMKGLWTGKKKLYIHANGAKEIMTGVNFALSKGLSPVIIGGQEAMRVSDFLAKNKVPVVINAVHQLPAHEDDDVDQPYKNAAQLVKAGVLTAITIEGFWNQRNIPFQAGTAAAYGLGFEEALKLITLNAATILGIQNTTGTVEIGKDANILICEGNPLDMNSQIKQAFIQGRELDLNSIQTQLYKRYAEKYGIK